MLKLNEIIFYQNCKKCIFDSRGKHVMEYLVEAQKKHIAQLEVLAPTLPNELKMKFSEISHILLSYKNGTSLDLSEASSPSKEPAEDSAEKTDEDDTNYPTVNEDTSKSDMDYLLSVMQKKSDFRKINFKLLDCLNDEPSCKLFKEILQEELKQQEILAHNYNNLSNTGRWTALL